MLSFQPIQVALNWSWSHYIRAEREADRAMRQQAEFAEMVKSLNAAQDRFEQANHELERARHAAEDAQRLKTEFAAMISHELRTPLNLIIGFSEMMAAGVDSYATQPLSPIQQRDIDTVYRNARHLSSLIDDILDLARIDALRMGLLRERVVFAELAREAVASIEPLFQRKGLRIQLDIAPDLPPLMLDRTRVRQILVNLLSNAGRFTEVGGAWVTAHLDEHDVVVSVTDTGVGIAQEALLHVFEEFRQLEGPLGRHTDGSGLGLAISKRLVELHGGAMWVESQIGQGSSFYFTLPTSENIISNTMRREWESWAKPNDAGEAARRIILIDDEDSDAAHILQRYLDGYQVSIAMNLDEVRRLRENSSITAVVLLGSAEQAIWPLAQKVKAQVGDLPVLVCALPGRRDLSHELGVVDYLLKPILREQLARVLRHNGKLPRDLLVIDDDPDLVYLLARMTRSIARRTRVRIARGGAEGLAALRERRPDLVLLDLLMPGIDGFTVLQTMRADESLRDIPVVVITAQSGRDETITAGMLGITRGGGLSIADLLRLVRTSLDELSERTTSTDPTRPAAHPV